jgi:hypothetical protein
MGLPKVMDSGETTAYRLPNGDVIGVATAVVPAVGRPELPELRATMDPIPVDATRSAGGSYESVGRVSYRMASSLGGLPPRKWTCWPRQSAESENSWGNR